jgi:signal transduction histidine kinase
MIYRRSRLRAIRGLGVALIMLLLMSSMAAAAQSAEMTFSGDENAASLTPHWQFWDDPADAADLRDAIEALGAGAYQTVGESFNRGYTQSTSWLYARVNRAADAEAVLYLLLEPVYLDEVDVFVRPAGEVMRAEGFTRHAFGDHRPVTNRALPQSRAMLPLAFDRSNSLDIFVRVRTLSTHFLDATLADQPSMEKAVQWRLFLHGGFVAVAMAIALVHLLLAYRLRERVLLIYALYVLSLGIGYGGIEGIANLVLPGIIHHLNDWLVGIGTGLSFALIAWLVIVIFDTANQHRWAHRFLQLVVLLGLAAFVATGQAIYPTIAQLLFIAGLFFLFIAFWLAWVHYRAGDPAGRLFLIAFSVSTIGATVSFLRILGLLPVNVFTQHAVQMSSFAHMILMTLALSERVLAAEDAAKQALRDAEQKAVGLANQMTEKLAESKKDLERTLARERSLRQEQSDFIDAISHEYRTPLSVLTTNIDILHGRGELGESRFAAMTAALRRLGGIFNDAMRTHRIGMPPQLALSPMDLAALIDEIISEFRQTHSDCLVRWQSPTTPVTLQADRRMMALVVFNLLENGYKYRRKQPTDRGVEVTLDAVDDTVRITVSNDVEPVDSHNRAELMERFVRGETAAAQPGSGLGLYLVKRGVEDMGGAVSIAETTLDRFEITIALPYPAAITSLDDESGDD